MSREGEARRPALLEPPKRSPRPSFLPTVSRLATVCLACLPSAAAPRPRPLRCGLTLHRARRVKAAQEAGQVSGGALASALTAVLRLSSRTEVGRKKGSKGLDFGLYIMHVLIGTYDLLGLMNLSAQLARRSIEIHFPRYHAAQPEDFLEFKKLLRTLQRHLPLPEEPDLQGHCDYFYEACLGCTGMLKSLLNKALAGALERQERTLTPKRWEQYAEPPQKRKDMLREIREGESAFEQRHDQAHRRELRTMLGLGEVTPKGETPKEDASRTATPPSPPLKAKKRRVGQRRAKRDPVGKEVHHV